MKTTKTQSIPTRAETPKPVAESNGSAGRVGPVLLLATCAILGFGLGLALTLFPRKFSPPPTTLRSTNGVQHAQPGPWGDVQYTRIFIEPPDNFVLDVQPWEASWFFKGHSRAQVEEVFQTAGLTPAQLRTIRAADWVESADGIRIAPGKEFILGLNRKARGKIYNLLGEFPENPAQYISHRYKSDTPEEWFHDSGLRPETQEIITRLVYKRGNFWAFSDFMLVVPDLDQDERMRLCKTLSRRSTLLLSLRVDQNSDIDGLARYWGRGGRSKDVGTLLSAVARQPNGGWIDIIHLLPPNARAWLYTYPRPTPAGQSLKRDCHWTSLNFFCEEPNDRFAQDVNVATTEIAEHYRQVGDHPLMGDIVGFVNTRSSMVHSCVYVAAGIVFTKNGDGWDTPWTLALLDDVFSFYCATAHEPLSVVLFRPIHLTESSP